MLWHKKIVVEEHFSGAGCVSWKPSCFIPPWSNYYGTIGLFLLASTNDYKLKIANTKKCVLSKKKGLFLTLIKQTD